MIVARDTTNSMGLVKSGLGETYPTTSHVRFLSGVGTLPILTLGGVGPDQGSQ